ncbi:hypothetical protein A0R60_0727 [Enterobacter asburiae]|nr:hypothetical protein A0R60_0727 [Enterobacter asburiae]
MVYKQTKWNMSIHVKGFVNVLKTITAHCVNERRSAKEKLHIQSNNDYYSHYQKTMP